MSCSSCRPKLQIVAGQTQNPHPSLSRKGAGEGKAAIHTSSNRAGERTALAIAEDTMKMPKAIVVPATIAQAFYSERWRLSH